MKHLLTTAMVALAIAAIAGDAELTTTANATLRDGSTVKGEFAAKRISGSTIFADDLDLNPALVKSLAFSGTNGESKVELTNGDKFAMTVANENFLIKSLLGELNIPRTSFRSLSLSTRKTASASGNGNADGLVFYCTFDDRSAVRKPEVGPRGCFLQGKFCKGKVGDALMTTVYAQNATFDIPANFFGTSGCIEFWVKILNPSAYIGNGGDPRLFTIIQKSTKNTLCTIDIVSNNGGGNSGFSTWTFFGNMASIAGMRRLRYDELFCGSDYRDWHHYAVVWDEDGIANLVGNPKMALLVDGKQIPDIQRHTRRVEEAMAILSSPMLLCITHDPEQDPERSTKSPFLIDEFKIWNHAKTEFDF